MKGPHEGMQVGWNPDRIDTKDVERESQCDSTGEMVAQTEQQLIELWPTWVHNPFLEHRSSSLYPAVLEVKNWRPSGPAEVVAPNGCMCFSHGVGL